jgi:transmembrane sensor
MDNPSAFIALVEKYLVDSITPVEEQAFLVQLESESNREILRQIIDARAGEGSYTDKEDILLREAGFEKLGTAMQAYEAAAPVIPLSPREGDVSSGRTRKPEAVHAVRQISMAAAAILLLGSITILYIHNKRRTASIAQVINRSAEAVAPLAPGGNKAILQLGNGSTIVLDSAHNGLLARQGAARVLKLDSGQLSYQGDTQAGAHPVVYNTISTPRGGQYQLVLPDGTAVWLNAASSLHFPTAFTGKDRTVTMTGEAYFEVAKDPSRPFHVRTGDMTVDVLGTHFNVMAYTDEKSVKTTLLEGAVKVSEGGQERLLSPGQQASLNLFPQAPAPSQISVRPVDVQQVIAWKNGFFEFDNMDLGTIMRQISRWYDVDIRYETADTSARFGGGISRKLNLPDVLRLLEVNGVHFRLENRTLTVIP